LISFSVYMYACTHHKFSKNLLSCTQKKNLYSFVEYYKILLKKDLIMSKSNICFNVIVLIEELNLRFADM